MVRIIAVFFLVLVAITAFFILKDREELELRAPTANIFGEATQKVEIANSWFPQNSNGWEDKNSSDLYLSSKAALVVDYDTSEVLFAKNADIKLPAASTIKILTTLIALENARLDDKVTVSQNAASIGENSMGLTAGETLTLEELFYGAMLVSGNDAAVAIAEGVAGSEQAFAEMMNKKVKSLGISDTVFVNATGLDEDSKRQYSTAYDMTTIAHYAWENYPEFRKIASTYEKYIPQTDSHEEYLLYNDTNLLTSYPGVRGIKPGFTWDAGWCLVTYAENDGKKLLGVILGSEDRRGEMVLLLDYAFAKYGIGVDHPGLDL